MIPRKPLTQRQKAELSLAQDGKCYRCGCRLAWGKFHDDHKLALIDGGTNDITNRALICIPCHRVKSAQEHKANAKVKRLRFGKERKSRPMAGTKASGWKHSFSEGWVRR